MLVGIITVSVIVLVAAVFGIFSLVQSILNFNSDKLKRNKNIVRFVAALVIFVILGGVDAGMTVKYIYDNREAADELVKAAIDKTAEYTVRGALATASTFTKSYNASVIKQFENLDISYSSSKFELVEIEEAIDDDVTDGAKKIYEIELVLDNKLPQNEEIYFGSLVQKNYLIACDADDFVYKIIPEDADSGFIKDQALISLVEFFVGREYTKFGKILPGKSLHKILVIVPEDVELKYLQFLDKKIDVPEAE